MCDGVAIYCISCHFVISYRMFWDPMASKNIMGELQIGYCMMCDGVAIYSITC
jgi:hypothetical protein